MSSSRLAIGLLAVLGLVALVFAASRPDGGGERPPRSSSLDDGATGLTTLVALLGEEGSDVQRLQDPPSADLPSTADTVFLLDPGEVSEADQRSLAGFLAGGGRLVLGGDVGAASIEGITGVSSRVSAAAGSGEVVPLLPVAETAGVDSLQAPGARFSSVGVALPIAGDGTGDLAAIASVGDGTAILLADSKPLQNGWIAETDNALFAVELAGGRPVSFVESLAPDSVSGASGLAALPGRWAYAGVLLMLGALAFLWSRFRRLGEPDRAARELPPPRSRYVEALADALTRTGSPELMGERVRVEARRRLIDAAGLDTDAGCG